MVDTIPDLWGEGIDVDDLSPAIILNTQAAKLQQRTKGVITAELLKRSSPKYDELLFDLTFELPSEAPQKRSRLLVCRYAKEEVYPAWISSLGLKKLTTLHITTLQMMRGMDQPTQKPRFPEWLHLDSDEVECTEAAYNQHGFVELLGKVLSSGYVKAKIASTIAQSNEAAHILTHLKEDPYYESASE